MSYYCFRSNYGEPPINIFDIFQKYNIAFVGYFNEPSKIENVNVDDFIVLTKGTIIVAIGKAESKGGKLSDLVKEFNINFTDEEAKKFGSKPEKIDDNIYGVKIDYIHELSEDDYISYVRGDMFHNINKYHEPIEQYYNKYKNKYNGEEMVNKYTNLLKLQKNIVLTGAPGTGKTHLAKQIAREMTKETSKANPIDSIKTYYETHRKMLEEQENECEKLRQDFINNFPLNEIENITLDKYCIGRGDQHNFCYWIEHKLRNLGGFFATGSGVYVIYYSKESGGGEYINNSGLSNDESIKLIGKAIKEIGKTGELKNYEIGESNLTYSFIIKVANSYNSDFYFPVISKEKLQNICDIFGIEKDVDSPLKMNNNIKDFFKKELPDISPWTIMRIIFNIFNDKDKKALLNNILTQSDSEDNFVNNKNIKFAQFHPSYDYTDFVEGLRPIQKESGEIGFELKNGIFKELCTEATKFPKNKFVMIIDEINRAEISKVFGELFFSIESGYRGDKEKVHLQYSNLYKKNDDEYYEPFKDGFYVPENVYIIATMNDIDRSIEPFDFAMKRRFAWHEIKPTDTYESMWESDKGIKDQSTRKEAHSRMSHLNDKIRENFSPAYEIGGAYFLKLNELGNDFNKLWKYHIETVLKDYIKGRNDADELLKEFKIAYDNKLDSEDNKNDNPQGQ